MHLNKKPAVSVNQKQYGISGGSCKCQTLFNDLVNRPPSESNRGLPLSTVINGGAIGVRSTAL